MLTALLGVGDKVAQEDARCPKLETQREMERCMIGEELSQHATSLRHETRLAHERINFKMECGIG